MKIEKSYSLPFPLEKVYQAWISSTTVIAPATRMDIVGKVGGHYRLFIDSADFTGINEGTFSRVEPDSRLTYTWEWNNDGDISIIDVKFTKIEAGTQVDLTHSGFSSQQSLADHDSGWDSYIQGFSEYLADRLTAE
ncbi:SRPBCC domain-containing protein [Paraglaciecola sp. L3A3]|uniref:SRPBCC family protein n=1 Tax=Paraglaciecola sp. L3A3 TaxID=2686358 RepID=UPI00131AFDB1|nr:SRPBCC domain-containing protein [Paraglaciecola sp. L3A3]